ncbi:hypothetical protein LEMLEM_LOCUS21505, partial [Lemmus lemmus]
MSHQISFRYSILKGYVQGEMDVLNIIDHIASSKQAKQILLKRVVRNMERAMKEIGYLEYDHPEMAVTMKTKEEINVMLNMAREIVMAFRLKGILHKMEETEINKLIMAKKIEVLDMQSVVQPLNIEESPYYIPWLSKDAESIRFIQVKISLPNNTFNVLASILIFSLNATVRRCRYFFNHGHAQIVPFLPSFLQAYFIPISHLYEGFEKKYPSLKHKMWQKIGLAITAQKIREHLPFEDWNYKMQLKLCNVFIRDIPKTTKTDIYDETVTHVVLIHGSAEDCQLRKIYKAPFLIPVTCHQ